MNEIIGMQKYIVESINKYCSENTMCDNRELIIGIRRNVELVDTANIFINTVCRQAQYIGFHYVVGRENDSNSYGYILASILRYVSIKCGCKIKDYVSESIQKVDNNYLLQILGNKRYVDGRILDTLKLAILAGNLLNDRRIMCLEYLINNALMHEHPTVVQNIVRELFSIVVNKRMTDELVVKLQQRMCKYTGGIEFI